MRTNRIDRLEEYLRLHKTATIDDLCQSFGVSKNTIRRDLDLLDKRGSIKKVYGGVRFIEQQLLIPYEKRSIKNMSAKTKIAERAAQLVNNGDVIFIDSGTTLVNLVKFLKDKSNITIFTHNLPVINQAVSLSNLNVCVLPGMLNRRTISFADHVATDYLSKFNITTAFIAATGISLEKGITNSIPTESTIKKAAIDLANKVCLVADSSKFDHVSMVTFCQFRDIDYLVTDQEPSSKYLDYFRQHHISCILSD